MYYILFLSRTNIDYLRNIIFECVNNNKALEITSKMIYCNDYYLQYIEGEEKTIRSLFDIISQDNRHNNIKIILEGAIENRKCNTPLDYKHIAPTVLNDINCSDLSDVCSLMPIKDDSEIMPFFAKLMK
ncbi:BLUF domain-containing protein [Fulvivirga sp. RKSG066]|uniref:BLUF domain-containing protein n=1 Tax=Fulvivirga aurantia TaxID=2529383 RepID=UPI0012BC060E|nr:BLUF domain-containing protein [Fulvivirga aurantia]MTI22010.1 BLUF domain-containing protein [Fulvivirga aurantia]